MRLREGVVCVCMFRHVKILICEEKEGKEKKEKEERE